MSANNNEDGLPEYLEPISEIVKASAQVFLPRRFHPHDEMDDMALALVGCLDSPAGSWRREGY